MHSRNTASPRWRGEGPPLASYGELCPQDRARFRRSTALAFFSTPAPVAGAIDPRLGKIDIIRHACMRHVGNAHNRSPRGQLLQARPSCRRCRFERGNIALAKRRRSSRQEMPIFCDQAAANGGTRSRYLRARRKRQVGRDEFDRARCTATARSGLHRGELGTSMKAAESPSCCPHGYVLTFSNGLVAYFSGDTRITADQEDRTRH